MDKKSQVKFGESFGVIIIVFLILMAGLVWYNKINTNSLNEINIKDQNSQAFEKYYYLNDLDLIHVSQRGLVDKELDLNALITFSNYSKTAVGKKYLQKRLKDAVITIKLYNETGVKTSISYLNLTLYNKTPNKNNPKTMDPIIFRTYFPVLDNNKKINMGFLEVKSFIVY